MNPRTQQSDEAAALAAAEKQAIEEEFAHLNGRPLTSEPEENKGDKTSGKPSRLVSWGEGDMV